MRIQVKDPSRWILARMFQWKLGAKFETKCLAMAKHLLTVEVRLCQYADLK